ncbi:glycosyltransferase [Brenneria tiliae]|uniref:Glycosyltransferase family protein n=1 Tax=Brenneria tiliae TaxID=2914984 RepID=A0ABT0MZF3_9GAMM|nr:glycosyltransferase [Brenneria tiliae]MCL2894643.1 glycosyltransferase family protein [Brenneria tiliae]
MNILAVSAVNNDDVLKNCLLRSPDINSGLLPLAVYRGYKNASMAYNQARKEAPKDAILIFVHQDVYLPAGFLNNLHKQLEILKRKDPNWGVLGCIGVDMSGGIVGETWSSGIGKVVGVKVTKPEQVQSVDELIIISKNDELSFFDDNLPSFHLYGTDIVQSVLDRGRKSYVVDLPIIHHSKPVISLLGGYSDAFWYMKKKWKDNLPITSTICRITPSGIYFLKAAFHYWRKNIKRKERPETIGNPAEIAKKITFEKI